MSDNRKYSSVIVDGVEQAPSRAMLHAVGFVPQDFTKPQIGIASHLEHDDPLQHAHRRAG